MRLADAGMLRIATADAIRAIMDSQDVWTVPVLWTPPAHPQTDPGYTFYNTGAGTVGNVLTTGSDVAGQSNWTQQPGGALTYKDNGYGLASGFGTTADGQDAYCQWDTTAATVLRAGCWVNPQNAPSSDNRLLDFRNTPSSGSTSGLLLSSTSNLRLMIGSSGSATNQYAITLDGSRYWIGIAIDLTNDLAWFQVYSESGELLHDTGSFAAAFSYTQATTCRFRPYAQTIGADTVWSHAVFDTGTFEPPKPWTYFPRPVSGYSEGALDPTPLTGTQWLSTGQSLINKDIEGRVVILDTATNVTIRGCRIRGSLTNSALLDCRTTTGGATANLIEDNLFEPSSPTAQLYNALSGACFTARKNIIRGVVDAVRADTSWSDELGIVFEGNLVEGLHFGFDGGQPDTNTHNDAIQIHSGPGNLVARWNDIRMLRDSSIATTHNKATSFLFVGTGGPTQHDLKVYANWVTGRYGAMVNTAVAAVPTTLYVFDNIADDTHPDYYSEQDELYYQGSGLSVVDERTDDGLSLARNVFASNGAAVPVNWV